MGDLTRHFSRSEFACNCECGQDTVDFDLVWLLEAIRDHFKASIKVTSGNRCKAYNERVGGRPNSRHLTSRAADIVVYDVDPHLVADWVDSEYNGKYGIGKYDNFTHVDSRKGPARWGFNVI